MMRPVTTTPARAQTAASNSRVTQTKADTAKAAARRNYKPPQTAS